MTDWWHNIIDSIVTFATRKLFLESYFLHNNEFSPFHFLLIQKFNNT